MALPNAMTVDVEDYFQVGVFQDRISQSEWGDFPCRVERNLDLCLELLDERGIKATFFVLGWIAERFPAAIRRLVDEGHEVGSHGQTHLPIWKLSAEEFKDDIARSQDCLGEILGAPPTVYRAPCFSVTRKTLWALPILHDHGIRYDSSIFPVSHPEYGIPNAETGIHRVVLHDGRELLEFPMTVGRLLGRKIAFCGGGYFRLFPYWLTRRSLRAAQGEGQPFVFYLHPWELDPDQPRLFDRAGPLGRFRHYVNLGRNVAKFRRLLDEFRFGPMRDVFRACEDDATPLPIVRY